ncbi:MAG: SHOCT domain-containing protein [Actinomycetota bacterium]|mgnify:CR=1 FL=1
MMWDNWGGGYGGAGTFGGILMMVFWVAVIIGIVLLIVWLVRQTQPGGGVGPAHHMPPHGETPLEILKKRYARGEIDKAEFEEKKKDLTG